MASNPYEQLSDSELWGMVIANESPAFEVVVTRHQGVVSAVTYSILGDFSLSQDAAQETFWQAWRCREDLQERTKLAAWLCGIARNIALQWLKKTGGVHATSSLQGDYLQPSNSDNDPVLNSISREESQLVWNTLSEIPESYRETLILYYRQNHSIQDVAMALDISVDAVKQRLHRGRELLRSQLTMTVEGILMRTQPSPVFTAKVMAGAMALATSFKLVSGTASAAMTSVAAKSATASLAATTSKGVLAGATASGVAGSVLGSGLGLGGAFLGGWLPAQLAPTQTESNLLRQVGRKTFIAALLYTVTLLAASLLFFIKNGWIAYIVVVASATIAFSLYLTIACLQAQTQLKRLRADADPMLDPNTSPLRRKVEAMGLHQLQGRRFTSEWKILGVPLLDVYFSDPMMSNEQTAPSRQAFGWVALGDRATGILFAYGGIAKGLIAFGGLAMGGLAVGGLSIGGLALGGGAVGWLAVGGLGMGYDAIGGMAIGWHSAAGGGAIANHIAVGGGAWANDFAIGGGAVAKEVNTPLARQVADAESYRWVLEFYVKNQLLVNVPMILTSLLPTALTSLCYKRIAKEEPPVDTSSSS